MLIGTTCVCDAYNYKEPEAGQVCVRKMSTSATEGTSKSRQLEPVWRYAEMEFSWKGSVMMATLSTVMAALINAK